MNMEENNKESRIEEEILKIRRVATKRQGGSSYHFSVLSVAGDRNGRVGVAIAKAKENLTAITKSKEKARKLMIDVPVTEGGTIPHEIYVKKGSAKILLKPAPLGAGIIAGSSVRQILELAGISNISAKIIGTNNQINNAYALIYALGKLKPREKKKNG